MTDEQKHSYCGHISKYSACLNCLNKEIEEARTQTAKEIFDDLDIQGIYDDYKTKADRFVITTKRYAKLKKKYGVK